MFGICLKRELSRSKKSALAIAMGLALVERDERGGALTLNVTKVDGGFTQGWARTDTSSRGSQR
ncbi:hypothetical protein [Streptomyces ortus]|uniref:Uncharacterized protein n=1 Tax=Streptomyces ortus TaxID=2867268 RepID=A0ABT3UZK5_9ACTN|nr:hypothetical protein [Streptomyces ortus]MCX4233195.1 hypothetical protein [Streptomyces ortus]